MDTIVIFDFDCTIIDVDSDPWVAEQLGLLPIFDELRAQMPWNDMMEVFLGVVQQQQGRGGEKSMMEEVVEALRCAPMQPSKISAIQTAHSHGCELRIISDANSFFIKTILDKYNVTHMFSEIHTNPIYVDEQGRLHIQPFHPKSEVPHGCPNCPPNMCKGRILNEILVKATNESKRIIYLGDGCGDFCPSLKLREGDCVLPRKGYPLLDLIFKSVENIKASIHPWGTGEEMEEILLNLINVEPLLENEHACVGVIGANCLQSALDQPNEVVPVTRVTA